MPPTIQNVTNQQEKRPAKPVDRKSEPICRIKYCNTLPDIPFDLKFISYPFDAIRFIQYNPTSLERNYRYEVLTEHDLGVGIDLINKDVYLAEHGSMLDPADEKLLEEDILTPQDSKRSRHHARPVSWLRRTEYISTEQTRFQPQNMDKVEAKVGYSIKRNLKNETLYMDRDSQVKAIEKTFEDARVPIEKHYSKPNVVPIEVLPIYPDFKIWRYPCAQVIFDSDPAPVEKQVPAQIEEMSQAMIRGVMDESGEQFVAYFLPTEETLQKRREDFVGGVPYQDDEEYEYKMAREYNWNVKSKASKGYEENYFLIMRQDGIFYNELETRVRLSKRRQKAGQAPSNTRLVVKHRPMDAQEFRMQRYREKQLEPPGEDDEQMDAELEDQGDDLEGNADDSDGESDEEKQNHENERSSRVGSRASLNRSAKSGSHSRSRSRSGSGSGSRSGSESRSGSRSRSRSGSKSGSGSRSSSAGSRSRSRSGSNSKSPSKSPSRSKSGSKSPAKSRSQSPSKSVSKAKSKSKSPSRSRSRSRSKSGSQARSASGSPSGSGSGSGSESGSHSSSGTGSESGSRSSSPSGSGSGSAESDGGGSGNE